MRKPEKFTLFRVTFVFAISCETLHHRRYNVNNAPSDQEVDTALCQVMLQFGVPYSYRHYAVSYMRNIDN